MCPTKTARMRRLKVRGVAVIWLSAVALMCCAAVEARAMPNFARRLGVSCATCHTSPPRLNETGFKFRAAGYRMPEEIGKEPTIPFKILDYTATRLQFRYDGVSSTLKGESGTESDSISRFNLFAAEAYLLYGPWGKYLSSNLKATIWPDKSEDTEGHIRFEGNIKATFGNADRFYELRAGVPHPMEGFGASDVAINGTRPYFQEHPADSEQSTFFTPWSFHQLGATFGYYQGRTMVRAYVLGGIRLHEDRGRLEPFGRKEPFTEDLRGTRHPAPDFQFFVNRILNHEGGAVSLYYYRGNVTLPIIEPNTTPTPAPTPGAVPLDTFQNQFDRIALYGSYPVSRRLTLFSGVMRGSDDLALGGRFRSLGAYVEATTPVINDLTHAGVRYDWFDPARNKANNEVNGVTVFVNAWYREMFRFVGEYRHLDVKQGLATTRKDHAFQFRLIFIK